MNLFVPSFNFNTAIRYKYVLNVSDTSKDSWAIDTIRCEGQNTDGIGTLDMAFGMWRVGGSCCGELCAWRVVQNSEYNVP